MSNMKPHLSLARATALVAGITALALVSACGKGSGGSARVSTRAADQKSSTGALLTAASKGKYNSNDEQNMKLARKIEGASATVSVAETAANEPPTFRVQARVLIGEENLNTASTALIAEGLVSFTEGSQAPVSIPKDEEDMSAKSVAPRSPGPAILTLSSESGADAANRFEIEGYCGDKTCSKLVIIVREKILGAEGLKSNRTERSAAFVFKTPRPGQDTTPGAMRLSWSPNVDTKDLKKGGVKQSFEAALKARADRGLPVPGSEQPVKAEPQPQQTPPEATQPPEQFEELPPSTTETKQPDAAAVTDSSSVQWQ